ncbi:MAG: hypothetical protein EHM45_02965 [Desulfobacteraceae bacterium]|nr:MAG: hypothetical protein EHM45_02965 [Desulfobacteraceae bacterium]
MPPKKPKANKTTSPFLPNIIRRPRLYKLLNHGRHYSVSWLTGPAGSGKTTLVADFLQTHKLDHIWYRLNEQDNDFSVFYSNLDRALQRIRIKSKRKTPPIVMTFGMRPLEFARRFFEAFCRRIDTSFYLVLDNYQVLNRESLFHGLLKEGIQRLTPGIRIIVISREDPPKTFSTLLANNQLRLMDNPEDLAFTLDETGSLIRRETNKSWPKEFISEIHAKTGGWVTGLVLIAKGLFVLKEEFPRIKEIPLTRIYDYFAAELFDRSEAEVRDLLLKTALLPRIVPEIASELTCHAQAGQLLNGLFKHHYFIERYGTAPVTYQFHPLFRDFLLAQTHKILPQREIENLQSRAAALFKERGLIDEAMVLYRQARQFRAMVDIIMTHSGDMIRRSRYKSVAEWIELLPEPTICRNPWLNYWLGFGYKFENPLKSKKHFHLAFNQFKKIHSREGMLISWSGAVDAVNMGWHGFREHDLFLKWFDQNIRIKDSFPSPEIEAYFLCSALMALLVRRPQHPDLEPWIERVLSLSDKSTDPFLPVLIRFTVIMIWLYKQTHRDRIELIRTELNHRAEQQGSDFFKCWAAYMEVLSFFWRDLPAEQVKETVAGTVFLTQKADIHFLDEYVFAVGVISSLMLGEYSEAQRYLAFFENSLKHHKRYEVVSLYYHMKTLYHLEKGEMEAALEIGQRSQEAAGHSGFILGQIRSRLGFAGVLIASKMFAEAGRCVALARKQAKKYGSPVLEYQAELFRADLLLRQGRKNHGLHCLRRALTFGKQHDLIRFIWWWNREILTHICVSALENDIQPHFVRRILQSYGLSSVASRTDRNDARQPIEIETLGQFRLIINGRALESRKKAKVVQLEMLKLLIALGPEPVSIEKIKTILWPDQNAARAASVFSSTLNRLRTLLESKEAIRLRNREIDLDPRYYDSDVRLFEHLLAQAGTSDPGGRLPLLEKAVTVYKGRFLENEPERSWIIEKQEELKTAYLSAVMELGAAYESRHKPDRALEIYKQALIFEPAEEALYGRLMGLELKLKKNADALKTYLRCKKTLQTVLGLLPSEEMQSLYRRLSNADPSRKKPPEKSDT